MKNDLKFGGYRFGRSLQPAGFPQPPFPPPQLALLSLERVLLASLLPLPRVKRRPSVGRRRDFEPVEGGERLSSLQGLCGWRVL